MARGLARALIGGALVLSIPIVYARSDCTKTSVGQTPLTDGPGLYPGGANTPPPEHTAAGVTAGQSLAKRSHVVLLSIGMSNARREFSAFKRAVEGDRTTPADPEVHRRVTVVNGAFSGCVLSCWSGRSCSAPVSCWDKLAAELQRSKVAPADVGAVWLKAVNYSSPRDDRDEWKSVLMGDLRTVIREISVRFPGVRQVYISSRIYAGYATSSQNKEPYAYDTGIAVREVLAKAGELPVWTAWGPYLWADGMTRRRDGFMWACEDFAPDGTHPSEIGSRKVADRLLEFFKTDPTTAPWFAAHPGQRR
jgi:hypothetical protein